MTRSEQAIIRDLRRKLRRWVALTFSGGLFSLFTVLIILFSPASFFVGGLMSLIMLFWLLWLGVVMLQIINVGWMMLRDHVADDPYEVETRHRDQFERGAYTKHKRDEYDSSLALSDDGELIAYDDDDDYTPRRRQER